MRTPRNKVRIAFVSWFAFVIAAMMLRDPLATGILLVPAVFVFGGYVMSIKCPKCRKPVLHNPIDFLGFEIWVWTCWVPKTCTKCGRDLK